jgi:PAS domain S-box-containing protein
MAPKSPSRFSGPISYASALLAVGIGWLLWAILSKIAGAEIPPFLTFYPAVMGVALLGGFGPGLFATIAATVVVDVWFVPPRGSFAIDKPADAVALAFFAGMGIVMSAVAERYRRARSEAAAKQAAAETADSREPIAENWMFDATMIVSLAILVGAGWLAERSLAAVSRADQSTALANESSLELERLLSVLKDAETGQRGYLLTGDQRYLDPYHAALADVARQRGSLAMLARNNAALSASLARIEPLMGAKLAELQQTVDLRRTNGLPAALRVVGTGRGKALMDQIRGEVVSAEDAAARLLQARVAAKERQSDKAVKALLGGGVFGFLALLVVFIFLKQENRRRRAAQRQLRQHRDQLQELVAARTRELDATNADLIRAVAEQRHANAALGESEARMRFALETIGAGAWEIDLDTRQAFRSAMHARIFGYAEPLGDWTYEKFIEHVLPEDRAAVMARFPQAAGTENQWNFECRIRRTDGEVRWIRVAARYRADGDGGSRRLSGLVDDVTDRRQAEEAARQGEQQFRTLADSIPNLAWWANGDGYITWYNRRWYEFTGTTPQQMEGWGWQQVHDPQMLPAVLERWKGSIATGEFFEMEFPLRRADGQFRWFLTRVQPVKDSAGRVQRWFGTNTDVSEAREAREALRESRAKLEAALASTTDAVFVADTDGRFIEINDAFAVFHRFRDKGEALKSLAEYSVAFEVFLDTGEPAETGRWPVTRALRGESGTNEELRLRRKDTGESWVGSYSFSPIRGNDGQIAGAVVIARDVTDRNQAEQAQAQLAAIVEFSDDAILSESLDGTILTWNGGAQRMFGYEAGEVVGQSITKLMPPQMIGEEAVILKRLKSGETIHHYETVRVAKDGRRLEVALTLSPVKDRQGRIIGASKIIHGISELVEARRVLTRSKQELERLVEERTARLQEFVAELEHFSYTIVHDMRAPLRAMQGFAEMLEQSDLDAESKKLLQRISNAARRMDLLITDALNYNRAIRQELAVAPLDAGEVLRSMLETYPELVSFKAQIEVQASLPPVLANEAGLTQCFSNLLGNAIKFVRPGQPLRIRVEAHTDGEWVRIGVADEGIGIPTSMLPRVFDMFSRGHQDYPGTGIGLALVRKVMDRMGGKVAVESEEGRGSRFWLVLKAAPPPAEP